MHTQAHTRTRTHAHGAWSKGCRRLLIPIRPLRPYPSRLGCIRVDSNISESSRICRIPLFGVHGRAAGGPRRGGGGLTARGVRPACRLRPGRWYLGSLPRHTLALSSQSPSGPAAGVSGPAGGSSGPAGGVSDGYGLGRGAAGPGRRFATQCRSRPGPGPAFRVTDRTDPSRCPSPVVLSRRYRKGMSLLAALHRRGMDGLGWPGKAGSMLPSGRDFMLTRDSESEHGPYGRARRPPATAPEPPRLPGTRRKPWPVRATGSRRRVRPIPCGGLPPRRAGRQIIIESSLMA